MTHCSTPAHTSIRRWLRSFTSCTLAGRFVAELCSRFCSQLAFRSWLLAVWRPQIWRDECMAIGFTRLLRMTSLRTLQTKIALQSTGRDQSLSIPAEVCGRPSGLSLSFTAATLSSLCVHFGLALPCLQSLLACFSQLLLSNVSSPSLSSFNPLPKNSASSLHEPCPLNV